jgi:hypothetical protein
MFGYVICNKKELSEAEQSRYQDVYCGLCKRLETRHGRLSRMSLNYDMTFLILFLSSLYEPQEYVKEFRCAFHPSHGKNAVYNKFTDYAADMTVALSYYKCLDDWEDERKLLSHGYANGLKSGYGEVKERYPRQCRSIEDGINELGRIEKSGNTLADAAVNCFGRLMSELFVVEEDFWGNSLRSFGFHLGKFIYLMDATLDYEKDRKKGNYNPLGLMGKKPEDMAEPLSIIIGSAADEFEKLPLVQDVNILKNILYGGVWQKYYAKVKGKEQSHD